MPDTTHASKFNVTMITADLEDHFAELGNRMTDLLETAERLGLSGRYHSIVVTKLEEAGMFMRRGIADSKAP
jgi:hypothetical protein